MTTATLKCTYCKERFPREQMIPINAGNFCSDQHILDYALAESRKRKQKDLARAYGNNAGRKKGKTKKDYDNDLTTRTKAAKLACHTYIRARDRGLPCICCGEPTGEGSQAGHWIPSGQNPQVRYDEDNIHLQRLNCNFFKGGDSGNYKYNLIKKIGIARTEALESKQGGTMKRTCEDYKVIEDHYKRKLKVLNNTTNQTR